MNVCMLRYPEDLSYVSVYVDIRRQLDAKKERSSKSSQSSGPKGPRQSFNNPAQVSLNSI